MAKNTIKVDFLNDKIIIDKTFMKEASDARSDESALLERTMGNHPTYPVVVREIKKNPKKESYKGLTYEYMRKYIDTVELNEETRLAVHAEMDRMILISQCHSQTHRYPVIRKWFLDKYEEITKFGMPELAEEEKEASAVEEYSDTVMMPAKLNANVESVLN